MMLRGEALQLLMPASSEEVAEGHLEKHRDDRVRFLLESR
jgi:hypothetical protein